MLRVLLGATPSLVDPLRILPSSLFRSSICSLIAVARLSWVIVRSNKFIAPLSIQSGWKSSAAHRLISGNDKTCCIYTCGIIGLCSSETGDGVTLNRRNGQQPNWPLSFTPKSRIRKPPKRSAAKNWTANHDKASRLPQRLQIAV